MSFLVTAVLPQRNEIELSRNGKTYYLKLRISPLRNFFRGQVLTVSQVASWLRKTEK